MILQRFYRNQFPCTIIYHQFQIVLLIKIKKSNPITEKKMYQHSTGK